MRKGSKTPGTTRLMVLEPGSAEAAAQVKPRAKLPKRPHPQAKAAQGPHIRPLRPVPDPDQELYAVAMLKVAMELKRDKAVGFEQIFENTLQAMSVDRETFRAYLQRNLGVLKSTAQKRGY